MAGLMRSSFCLTVPDGSHPVFQRSHSICLHQGRNSPRLQVIAFLVVAVLPSLAVSQTPAEVLAKAMAARSAITSYTARIETDLCFLERVAKNPVDIERYSAIVSVDGERIDVAWLSEYIIGGQPKPSHRVRGIWDGRQYLLRQQYLGRGARQVQVVTSNLREDGQRLLDDYNTGSFARGMIRGDSTPVLQAMSESGQVQLRTTREIVDGGSCFVLETAAASGRYAAWIDPDSGYVCRRIRVVKEPGHRIFGQPLPYKSGTLTWTGLEVEVRIEEIERHGEVFVPVAAVMECRESFQDGKNERTVYRTRMKDLRLRPDFTAIGAFVMDGIPDGSPVLPKDRNDHLIYVWRGGRVVVDVNEEATKLIESTIAEEQRQGAPQRRTNEQNR